jgi:hypothetical protein
MKLISPILDIVGTCLKLWILDQSHQLPIFPRAISIQLLWQSPDFVNVVVWSSHQALVKLKVS